MTILYQPKDQKENENSTARGVAGIAAVLVVLAIGAVGGYAYNPGILPEQATDFLARFMTPTTARHAIWFGVVILLIAAFGFVVIRWCHRRPTVIGFGVLIALVVLVVGLYAFVGVGVETFARHLPRPEARTLALVAGAEAVILGVAAAVRWDYRRRRRFAAGLVDLFPAHARINYQPLRDCRTGLRWRRGRPLWVRLQLPEGFATTSGKALVDLTKAMGDRLGAKVEHELHINEITFTVAAVKAEEVDREHETNRVWEMAKKEFGSTLRNVHIAEWGGPKGNTPSVLSLKYSAEAPDTNLGFQRRVEVLLSSKLDVRYKGDWKPTSDTVELRERPPMPERIDHPGVDLFKKGTRGTYRPWNELPFGVNENGETVCWDTRLQSHGLGNGATNTGKTITARSIIVAALVLGWEVYLLDPKRIELSGFRHDWGVKSIATAEEDMADLLLRLRQVMDDRYTEIETKSNQGINPEPEKYRPALIVMDEFAELAMAVGDMEKARKNRGSQSAIKAVDALGRLARACNMHMLIMTQRPDAEDFPKGGRDNLTFRYSMNGLSEQGAKMMWQNTAWGRYVPPVKGRGMAGVYTQEPQEVQCYWMPDPAFPKGEKDTRLRDELRAECQRVQAGVSASITGADYDLPPVQPSPEGDLDRIVTDPGELLPVILGGTTLETASALADSLISTSEDEDGAPVDGDRIIVNDRVWEVEDLAEVADQHVAITIRSVDTNEAQTITRTTADTFLRIVTDGTRATRSTRATDNDLSELPPAAGGGATSRDREDSNPADDTGADIPLPPMPFADDDAADEEEDFFAIPEEPAPESQRKPVTTERSPDSPPAPPPTPPREVLANPSNRQPEPGTTEDESAATANESPASTAPAEDDALVATLRRAWESIPDSDARDALLASAPDTPAVTALKAELATASTSEPTTGRPPADSSAAEVAEPDQDTSSPEPDSVAAGCRVDQLKPGDRVVRRNKKGQYVPYTVQDVEPTDSDTTLRVTLKPARGRNAVVDLPVGELVQLEKAA